MAFVIVVKLPAPTLLRTAVRVGRTPAAFEHLGGLPDGFGGNGHGVRVPACVGMYDITIQYSLQVVHRS